jgi:glucose-6-phosphate isomerase
VSESWRLYQEWVCRNETLGLELDLSHMLLPEGYLEEMAAEAGRALTEMEYLEAGGIANPDEGRQVGHYWLRAPELAPTAELSRRIVEVQADVREFALRVHSGLVRPPRRERFTRLLLVGIGGSALGPQLLADAFAGPRMLLSPAFLDNTDPDGMRRVLAELGEDLDSTLTLVVSKSGGTRETRNGMLAAAAAYRQRGLRMADLAVAVTGPGSELDGHAAAQGWLARFPMWDWVGGRTSLFSAVGLLPAALMGLGLSALLSGAREMDLATRARNVRQNPALLLALAWYHAGEGRGLRDMVVLPYRDRLQLLARYLQQLVMESLGKEFDLAGRSVHQGLVVYGNKGSTDQHAYVQQLRDGPDNFFVTFVQTLQDAPGRDAPPLEVEPGITSGDYLHGFLLGTRRALAEKGRRSLTISLTRLDEAALGALVALFERAVGHYATLVGINAYHQPGVEAGKVAAGEVLALQRRALAALQSAGGPQTAQEIAVAAGAAEEAETVYLLLRHLAANPGRGVARRPGRGPADDVFLAGAPAGTGR